jgi:hypothetical protein
VLAALASWRSVYPQFGGIWDAADPDMRAAFLRWMSSPRLVFHRRDRVRTVVRETLENNELRYSKISFLAILQADASLNLQGG